MKYVPTITGKNFNRLDFNGLTDGDEILFTPSVSFFTRNQIPSGNFNIIIDNGCYLFNELKLHKRGKLSVDKRMNDHIRLCKVYGRDKRCVFILPDLCWDSKLSKFWIDKFLKEVKPKRFALADWPSVMEYNSYLADDTEFLCTKCRKKLSFKDLNRYHFLGALEDKVFARSYDDVRVDTSISLKQNILNRSY